MKQDSLNLYGLAVGQRWVAREDKSLSREIVRLEYDDLGNLRVIYAVWSMNKPRSNGYRPSVDAKMFIDVSVDKPV